MESDNESAWDSASNNGNHSSESESEEEESDPFILRFQINYCKNKLKGLKRKVAVEIQKIVKKSDQIEQLNAKIQELRLSRGDNEQRSAEPIAIEQQVGQNELQKTLHSPKSAQAILPEEIWHMIFQYLGTKDLQNVYVSCQLFHDILETTKCLWLFDEVLPILYNYLGKERTLLPLRLTCRKYNRVVDTFINNHPKFLPYYEEKNDPENRQMLSSQFENIKWHLVRFFTWYIGPYSFHGRYSFQKVQKFKEKFALSLNSPFLGRIVRMSTEQSPFENDNQYWNSINNFLNDFGRHIWRFCFNFIDDELAHDKEAVLQLFTNNLFFYAENLRTLVINNIPDYDYGQVNISNIPAAPNLTTLEISTRELVRSIDLNTFNPICKALVKKFHNQLVRLSIPDFETLKIVSRLKWPLLKALCVVAQVPLPAQIPINTQIPWGGYLKVEFKKLPSYLKAFPQLHRLEILAGHGHQEVNEVMLIKALNRLVPHLPHLHVLRITRVMNFTRMGYVEMPRGLFAPKCIDTLEIDWVIDLDLLIRFPFVKNLKILQINENEEEVDEDEEIVEVYKYLKGNMYQSNIWEMMPYLNFLTIKDKLYTRKRYEQFREKYRV